MDFRELLRARQPALAEAIVEEIRRAIPLFAALPERTLREGFAEMVARFLDAAAGGDVGQVREFISTRLIARLEQGLRWDEAIQLPLIFRRQFSRFSAEAVALGAPGAGPALEALIRLSEEVGVQTASFYQQRALEQAAQLARARDALFAEVSVAQQIQTLLLPRQPALPGFAVAGATVPAAEVGGDYYDVLQTEGRAFVAIGDVSGHGLTSGLTMMMARAALLAAIAARPEGTLGSICRALNASLFHNLARLEVPMFMTFALLEHLGAGRFAAVGRHLPPLHHRLRDGAVRELELTGGWLGVAEELAAPETRFELEPGDSLVLYTDGLIEQPSPSGGEMFGAERLAGLVAAHAADGPAEFVAQTFRALRAFSPAHDDDQTLLALTRLRLS